MSRCIGSPDRGFFYVDGFRAKDLVLPESAADHLSPSFPDASEILVFRICQQEIILAPEFICILIHLSEKVQSLILSRHLSNPLCQSKVEFFYSIQYQLRHLSCTEFAEMGIILPAVRIMRILARFEVIVQVL